MNQFQFNTTARIIFGAGQARRTDPAAVRLLGSRPIIVSDPGLAKLGLLDQLRISLSERCDEVDVFSEVEADPSLETVKRVEEIARSFRETSVIGFGGGSSMDVAKVVALLLGSSQKQDEIWGVGNAIGPRLPLMFIPTTAGTGSEVTPIAIITIDETEKRGISAPVILPDVAILDPELTVGLPASITAFTGIDAMVHAIEAVTSTNLNNNPMSRMLAKEALRILGGNIETAVRSRADLEARGQMLLGSMYAGQAFANSPVAAVHALAYPLGSRFHIPHGLSNAIVLPHVIRFNMADKNTEMLYIELANIVFPNPDKKSVLCVSVYYLADSFEALSVKLGLHARHRDLGIAREDLPMLAEDAMLQTRLLINNPMEIGASCALKIYEAAF